MLGVDASQLGVDQATENAALNGLSDRVTFTCADVFELLPQLERGGQKVRCGDPGSPGLHEVPEFREKCHQGL